MAIELDPDQLQEIKARMAAANAESHFVIFESEEVATGKHLRLITDVDSFYAIQEQHATDAHMAIVQDIVPITETLVKWAVAENGAARDGENPAVLAELDYYTNAVLQENGQPVNEPDDD